MNLKEFEIFQNYEPFVADFAQLKNCCLPLRSSSREKLKMLIHTIKKLAKKLYKAELNYMNVYGKTPARTICPVMKFLVGLTSQYSTVKLALNASFR